MKPGVRLTAVAIILWALALAQPQIAGAIPSSALVDATVLSPWEREVVREMNLLRADPPAYAARLQGYRQYYEGELLHLPGQPPIRTLEGVCALEEAISALRDEHPAPPLTPSRAMSLAARDHQRDLADTGALGHGGSDGSDVLVRLARYGWIGWTAGENISFGETRGRQVVIDLVVDDGVPDRGHRRNILNRAFREVGVACGSHPRVRRTCVIDFTNFFKERAVGSGSEGSSQR